jgi:hypothetical protein
MASANRPANLQTVFNSNSSSLKTVWDGPVLHLTEKPNHFGPFVFRNRQPDSTRLLSFCLGGQDSVTIWLDSVIVEKTDDPENLRREEELVAIISDTLNQCVLRTSDEFLKLHFKSVIKILNSKENLLKFSYSPLVNRYTSFTDPAEKWNPKILSTYLERKRTFIVAWTSPTDGKLSFSWLLPPKNWNPQQTYPLYVSLHGLWSVADNPIDYLTYHLAPNNAINEPYDDGYLWMPWGRGNFWYEGISETDIWEGIDTLESIVKIDSTRKFLTGHSMGGYGSWALGQKTPEIWAALGIHAGALWYGGSKYLNAATAQKLKNVPIYFVCGDQDGLLSTNQTAYGLLHDAGNENIKFTQFHGGHEYLFDNVNNMYEWIRKWQKGNPLVVEENSEEINSNFQLFENYPNPFNPSTIISYYLPYTTNVQLKIFDSLGREVITLINQIQSAGDHKVILDAQKMLDGSNAMSSGVYFCRIHADSFTKTIKMLLMR